MPRRQADFSLIPTAPPIPCECGSTCPISGPSCPLPATYFTWQNSNDKVNFPLIQMDRGESVGYRFVQGVDVEATKKLARDLGLTESHVNTATNRIAYAELVLMTLPLAEHVRRRREALDEALFIASPQAAIQANEARIDGLNNDGITAVAMPVAELADRQAHADRDGQPFVSMSPPSSPSKTAPARAAK